jgi:hypothetical protein
MVNLRSSSWRKMSPDRISLMLEDLCGFKRCQEGTTQRGLQRLEKGCSWHDILQEARRAGIENGVEDLVLSNGLFLLRRKAKRGTGNRKGRQGQWERGGKREGKGQSSMQVNSLTYWGSREFVRKKDLITQQDKESGMRESTTKQWEVQAREGFSGHLVLRTLLASHYSLLS